MKGCTPTGVMSSRSVSPSESAQRISFTSDGVRYSTPYLASPPGGSPRRAWEEAAGALPLEEADREALAGLTLSGDEERVRREAELARVRLERSLAALEARRPEDEKRSAALCLSAAALLVILLI